MVRMRKLLLAALLLGGAVALVALAQPKPQPQPPPEPPQKERRFEPRVTPEMKRHSRISEILYFVDYGWSAAALLLILATGSSTRLRALAARAVRWRWLVPALYFVLLTLVTTLLEFPLDLYGGFIVPHQFDLTNQSFASWLGDLGKGLGVNLVIGALLATLLFFAIRRFKRWWFYAWLGSLPLIVIGIIVTPLIIDPLFNKFEPLKDPVLRAALLDEASRAGIENGRVYQVDKSKQTKTMNAYVTGIGPSARIVMWDTLLAKLDRDEVLAVMGHEMGHYVMKHLWKGFAFAVLVTFFGFWLGQALYDRGLRRWGTRWSIDGPDDPAALPWLLVISLVISFFLSPVTSGFSRHLEHQADIFGLELTHLNEPMASSFVKFSEDSKYDPDPPRFIEWWYFSHPSTRRRVEFVLHYRPWLHVDQK